MKKKIILLLCLINFQYIYNHKVIVFSMEKCGTHLLTKAIELLTNSTLSGEWCTQFLKENGLPENIDETKFYRSHSGFDKKIEQEIIKKNYKAFFIYRDPRDQIVSNAYWLLKKDLNITSNKISNLISSLINQVSSRYNNFIGWNKSPVICSVKFENLIGKNGGGCDLLQKSELHKIAKFLEINSEQKINYTIANLYGGTWSFREGKIGSWKSHFSKEHKIKFQKFAGQLLLDLGYEKNLK